MYRKKYGKMTFAGWLNAEMEKTGLGITVAVGVILAVACIAVRISCGGPHEMILALGIADLVPPVWLMSAMRFLSFFTAGCAAGLVLGYKDRSCLVEKYRGGMFFVLLAVLELCWYPTVFGAGLLFLAMLEALIQLFLAIVVTISFFKVSRLAGWIMTLHCVWLSYLMILTFAIFFRA